MHIPNRPEVRVALSPPITSKGSVVEPRSSDSRQCDVHSWMDDVTRDLFSLINKSSRWHTPERRGRISTRKSSVYHGPILAMDNYYAFREYYVSCDERVSEVRHIESLPTMVKLARKMQNEKVKQGKVKIIETMDFSIPDIFKQVFLSPDSILHTSSGHLGILLRHIRRRCCVDRPPRIVYDWLQPEWLPLPIWLEVL